MASRILNSFKLFVLGSAVMFFIGCAGQQKVIWSKTAEIDYSKGCQVELKANVFVPEDEMDFMKKSITEEVHKVLIGNDSLANQYFVHVTITQYDEGSAFARFMLAGLGQMKLFGTIKIFQGEPPVVIREGEFQKVYSLGGIAGASATMRNSMTSKIGSAIAKAIQEAPKK